jgi:hypothetical protein
MKKRDQSWQDELDEMIGSELDEQTVDALVEFMTPEQTWPQLDELIYVSKHPTVWPALQRGDVPEKLEQKLSECLETLLPMLGTRGYGPVSNHVEKASRVYKAERKKYNVVIEKLEELNDKSARISLLKRFLDTDPAPLFSSRLRSRYPLLIQEAEESRSQAPRGGSLVPDPTVIQRLKAPRGGDAELTDLLDSYLQQHPSTPSTIEKALEAGSADQKLMGAALAVYKGEPQYGPLIVDAALELDDYSPYLAILGALVAPTTARNIFSQFLTEASLTDPDKPESKAFAGKSRTILALRSLLPKLDSPLSSVTEADIPENIDEESLDDVPGKIDALWDNYQQLLD